MSRTLDCEVTGFGFRAEQVGSPFGWGGRRNRRDINNYSKTYTKSNPQKTYSTLALKIVRKES